MKRNLKLMFLILACTLMFVATEATQANPGVIAIEPAEIRDISPGGSFYVNVTVTDVSEVYGWQVNITYNPQILNVDNVTEGTFLKQVNQTVFMKAIDNTGGYVLLSSLLFPIPEQGASGNGLLVHVAFSVKGSGSSSLHFEKDGTKLRRVIGDNVDYITDFSTTDASFRNAASGLLGGIPLEYIAGAVVVVVVIAGSSVFLLRRRKNKGLIR